MKKSFIILTFLAVSQFAVAQDSFTGTKPCCFEEYYETFTNRGALPVPDGEHLVVFSARKEGECFCGEGKITMKDGNLIPGLLIKKTDGSFEPSPKTLHHKTNVGEAENPNKFKVTNGMSSSFLTEDYYIVNLFFINYLKVKGIENVPAPSTSDLAGTIITPEDKDIVDQAESDLSFETGKSIIKPSSYAKLDQLAAMLMNQGYKLDVFGYTDNTGSAEINLKVSQARADAVKNYLVEKGVPEKMIIAKGFGILHPIADNATAEGRAKNRRVEFAVTR